MLGSVLLFFVSFVLEDWVLGKVEDRKLQIS